MELKMEVYTPDLELIGVLEAYRSVLWEAYAFQAGSFSVEALITPESVALLAPEHILWIEGETAGVIESVQQSVGEDGPYITVKGPLLTGLLARRILWGRYDLYGAAPALMYGLVDDCAVNPTRGDAEKRRLPGLALDGVAPAGGEAIRKQKTGGSLLEALEELGEARQTAFGVCFNPQVNRMEFWARRGVNRSTGQTAAEPVCLSTELDDVLSSEYVYDAGEYKNVALVAGEGEGGARKVVPVIRWDNPDCNLPDGYSLLDYIQSNGTQYIDTGFKPSTVSRVIADIKIDALPASTAFLFSTKDSATVIYGVVATNNQRVVRTDYFGAITPMAVSNMLERVVIDKNQNVTIIGSTTVESEKPSGFMQCEHSLFIFSLNNIGSPLFSASFKLYSMKLFEDGIKVRDFVPCKNSNGEIGLFDLVGRQFYGNSGTGFFEAGSIIAIEPGGFLRRELYVDARNIQTGSDPESALTDEAYTAVLQTKGFEKLAEAQLVRSFSAVVRTHNPTYEYGVDFLLGDTITVTDERLNLSVDAVVQGVERGVDREGEHLSLVLGYDRPTLYERLQRKAAR